MRREMGAALVAAAFLLAAVSVMQSAASGSSNFGGVLMIGPIPIIFGSSPQMALISIASASAFIILVYLLRRSSVASLPEEKGPREIPSEEKRPEEREGAKIKGGAVVMIGPIPIVIGSDPKTALVLMLLALAITLLWALAFKIP